MAVKIDSYGDRSIEITDDHGNYVNLEVSGKDKLEVCVSKHLWDDDDRGPCDRDVELRFSTEDTPDAIMAIQEFLGSL